MSGKQVRPASGYVYSVPGGLVGLGTRNVVDVAHKVCGWGKSTGHDRAQVLYDFAENLSARAAEFEDRLATFGIGRAEVGTSVQHCFWYAAQADKFDGVVHQTKTGHVTLPVPEPLGSSASPVPWPGHCWAS